MIIPSVPTTRSLALGVSLAAVLGLGAVAVKPTDAYAIFAQEGTQILNKVFLGKQLVQQEIISEQTLLAILPQAANLNGLNNEANRIARRALGSLGVPYELIAALGTHQRTYRFDPDDVISWSTVMPRYGMFMDELDRAAFENVAAIAEQQEAALAQQQAVAEQVALSQTSVGANQALMVSNQLHGATISTLQQIQSGLQAGNYIESRKIAGDMADLRAAYMQRNYDTRDFLTGPMPAAGAGPGGDGGGGSFFGM